MISRDTVEADLPAILTLHNHMITTSKAIWSDEEVGLEDRQGWFRQRLLDGFPVISAVDQGAFLGFGSYGPWRGRAGYRFTVEHSVYVTPEAQGQGVGGAILVGLVERAKRQGIHTLIGGVEASNVASLRLHKRHGVHEAGRIKEAGRKFDEWLDLVFVQLVLPEEDSLSGE